MKLNDFFWGAAVAAAGVLVAGWIYNFLGDQPGVEQSREGFNI